MSTHDHPDDGEAGGPTTPTDATGEQPLPSQESGRLDDSSPLADKLTVDPSRGDAKG